MNTYIFRNNIQKAKDLFQNSDFNLISNTVSQDYLPN